MVVEIQEAVVAPVVVEVGVAALAVVVQAVLVAALHAVMRVVAALTNCLLSCKIPPYNVFDNQIQFSDC